MNMSLVKADIVQRKIIFLYLLMLVGHFVHVFEEIWGHFWILNTIGLKLYLTINVVLFCIPVVLFYFVLHKKRWAYKFSLLYVSLMGLQGIGHNVATIITGKYFDGFAGGFSGILLLIIALLLLYFLWKEGFQKRKE